MYNIRIDDTDPKWHHYFLCGFRGILECETLGSPVGMNVITDGIIPPNAGLSSSSALVCCAAMATMHANGFQIPKVLRSANEFSMQIAQYSQYKMEF